MTYMKEQRIFKPNYMANLVQSWIPSLGVEEQLKNGAKVADIGCGYGISTAIKAKAYLNSQFNGFDNHAPSIEAAKENINKEDTTTKNVNFSIVYANDKSLGNDCNLVTFFDCLHDIGDPVGALKFAK